MKKYLLLIVFALTVFAAQAQKGSAVKLPLAVGDTITNTGTVSKFITVTGGYSGVSLQYNVHKLSGTGAGTIQLYGSLDGVTYVAIGSASTITNVADQAFTQYVASPLPSKLKILATGSGTESAVLSVWYRTPIFQSN